MSQTMHRVYYPSEWNRAAGWPCGACPRSTHLLTYLLTTCHLSGGSSEGLRLPLPLTLTLTLTFQGAGQRGRGSLRQAAAAGEGRLGCEAAAAVDVK